MIAWLNENDPFPPVTQALGKESYAPGLLAASEYLTPERLLQAYQQGVFPWYSEGQVVLWWSPDPRMVLSPSSLKISTSLRKLIKHVLADSAWEIRVDDNFSAVMQACAEVIRKDQQGTWITQAVIAAYTTLHQQGQAHSVEVWCKQQRVAGLYGVMLGRMFFGESMFTQQPNCSKLALVALCAFLRRQQIALIDCQQETAHLASLGAVTVSRRAFIQHVKQAVLQPDIVDWHFDKGVLHDWLNIDKYEQTR